MVDAIPGVVGRAQIVVHAGAAIRELDGLGLAQENHAGTGESGHHGRIGVGNVVAEEVCACGGGQSADVEEILGRIGDPVQRPQIVAGREVRLGSPGRRQRTIRAHELEGAERLIQIRDAGQQRLGERHRRQLTTAQTTAQLGDGLVLGLGNGPHQGILVNLRVGVSTSFGDIQPLTRPRNKAGPPPVCPRITPN